MKEKFLNEDDHSDEDKEMKRKVGEFDKLMQMVGKNLPQGSQRKNSVVNVDTRMMGQRIMVKKESN